MRTHLFKLSLAFSLCFLSSLALNAGTDTLDQSALIEEVCTFMDQAQKCERYWQEINHSTFKKYVSSWPHRWFDKKWHQETPLKADLARALFDKLAHFLGVIEGQQRSVIEQDWKALKEEAQTLLNSCTIPYGVERHWVKYGVALVAMTAVYLKMKHSLGKQILFEIPPTESLAKNISHIPNSSGTDLYVSTYRLSQQAGTQFIEVPVQHTQDVEAFLTNQHINFTSRTPHIADLTTHFYNPEGKTHIAVWLQEHCIKPCANLYDILFKDKQHDIGLEVVGSNANDTGQLHHLLGEIIQDGSVSPNADIKQFFAETLQARSVEDLTLDQRREINLKFYFYLCKHAHKLCRRYLWMTSTFQNVAEYDLISKSLLCAIVEKYTQSNAILNVFRDVAQAQRLTLAMMSAVPVAVIGYLSYKGGKSLAHRVAKRTFIQPLKQDLLSLQITLNSHRYEAALDTHTRGLCRYWTTRLGSYLKKLSSSERPRYAMYLEQLEHTSFTADQKIQAIECMFKEFSFLRS